MKEGLIAAACILALLIITGILCFVGGRNSVKVEQFDEYKATVEARDALQQKLNDSDVALQKTQKELSDARAKRVVEKVTVYRDRIKNAATSQCVKESGILEMYDQTVK